MRIKIYRWSVLLLISLAMFGNYYIYDSISPLADILKTKLAFSDSNIGMLNAIYSIPNIIMVLIGGIIIDRIGVRKSGLFFTVIIAIGALITALYGNIYCMAVGRLIFGLGAESMIIAINTVIARWFKANEMAFAFSLNTSVARLGTFFALNSPSWANSLYNQGYSKPLWLAFFISLIAVLCMLVFFIADKIGEDKKYVTHTTTNDKIDIKTLFKFHKSFWIISSLCVFFYAAMFPFQTFAVKFFRDVHGASRQLGGLLSSILTLAALVFTPIFGYLADKMKKPYRFMVAGSGLIIPVYLLMAYNINFNSFFHLPQSVYISLPIFNINTIAPLNLLIPMSFMGISFALVPAVLWPSVAAIVEPTRLGTAYGTMSLLQNIGLSAFNLAVGFLNDLNGASGTNPSGYYAGMWLFSCCGVISIVLSVCLSKYLKRKA